MEPSVSKQISPTANDYNRILKTFSRIRYAHSSYAYLPKGCDARALLMNDPEFSLSLTFVNFLGEFTGLFKGHDIAVLWDDDNVKGTRLAIKAKTFARLNEVMSRLTAAAGVFEAPPSDDPACGCPECGPSSD